MFALATAIKVFPVAVLPYLVWRRQWAAAASMLVFSACFCSCCRRRFAASSTMSRS